MADPELTLKQVVDYCQEHELLLRLLGIPEEEIIHHNSKVHTSIAADNRRKPIDDSTRNAIDELVRLGVLRREINQDKRALFPGDLWSDRLAILNSREER